MRATFAVCGTVAHFITCAALAEPTRTVDDSPAAGAIAPADRPDSLRFALGLAGSFALLAQDSVRTAGAILDLHYEMSRLEAGFDLRGGGASSGGFFACSVGARRFMSQGDVTPYFGGGLAWSVFSFNPAYDSNASGSGLGAYAGAGIETLRTHHGHLALGLRLDVPFFGLTESGMVAGYNAGPRGTIFRGPQTTYYAPLTLETRLTF
jgi:hypothetical protein